ncbi:MAG: TIGR01212 family radical SAM protein [Epsilonproteobacteria bacterium]|nr:TIGR01212 family radical SAM protein [Campylobacterota bacterium]
MENLYTFGKYLKSKYNLKIKKLPVSIPGFTCPNIDGSKARGGCVFCENESFSPNFTKEKTNLNFHSQNPILDKQLASLNRQYHTTAPILRKYYSAQKFILYFQSFTNTYAPFETLKTLYLKALSLPDVIGISIGTRADSIEDKTLHLLKDISREKEVWVEYGIQSSNNQTLNKINRAETFEEIALTVKKTKDLGLNVCAHLIFGLPGESKEDMLKSTQDVIDLNIDSIKFHPLYITPNTRLAIEYKKGKFKPISQKEYIDVLIDALKLLPQNISIQRMSAGSEDLLAPKWCKNKSKQISAIYKALNKAGIKT